MKLQVCRECESDYVYYDAYVNVNDRNDVITFDAIYCSNCDGFTTLKEIKVEDE
jgi:hypothetical protein